MKKKVYIATRWENRDNATRVALNLTDLGFEVTSRWLRGIDVDSERHQAKSRGARSWNEYLAKWAKYDVDDVVAADMVLLLVRDMDGSTGGAWFEFGYAMALKKRVIAVCQKDELSHVFLALPNENLVKFEKVADALTYLQAMTPSKEALSLTMEDLNG